MSCLNFIHIYFQADHSLRVLFAGQEVLLRSQENLCDLEAFFLKQLQRPKAVKWFIDVAYLTFSEVAVPATFDSEDILQFIYLEQAKLFPMLEQDIYVDFLISSRDEETQTLMIMALNCRDFSSVVDCLKKFSLPLVYFGISKEEFKTLNLLPWRQEQKQKISQLRRRNVLLWGSVIAGMVIIISVGFVYLSHHDAIKTYVVNAQLGQQKKKLFALEKSNRDYHQLKEQWDVDYQIAQHQAFLEKALVLIEAQRPPGLVLKKIQLMQNEILIDGNTSDEDIVKNYIAQLQQFGLIVQLKSLKNISDTNKQFELLSNGVN